MDVPCSGKEFKYRTFPASSIYRVIEKVMPMDLNKFQILLQYEPKLVLVVVSKIIMCMFNDFWDDFSETFFIGKLLRVS